MSKHHLYVKNGAIYRRRSTFLPSIHFQAPQHHPQYEDHFTAKDQVVLCIPVHGQDNHMRLSPGGERLID